MGAAAIPIIGLAVAAAGTAAQVHSSRRAARLGEMESDRQAKAQNRLIAQTEAQRSQTQSERARLAERQRRLAAGGGLVADRGTILTGPSGLANAAPGDTGERKTLLGL